MKLYMFATSDGIYVFVDFRNHGLIYSKRFFEKMPVAEFREFRFFSPGSLCPTLFTFITCPINFKIMKDLAVSGNI